MDLLNDKINRIYMRFLIPSLGSAMVMSIYTLTDAIVIGKGVGAKALAALSFTTPLLCILMATGILFGIGGSVQMSVFRGSGNETVAKRYFTLSFIAISVITVILWLAFLLLMPQIIKIMGATNELYPYVFDYMRYIDYFLPFAVFSNYLAIFIRADNDPNRAMIGVISGGILNIILDIVFVFPLKMGIGGAALASAIGMVMQVIIAVSHFLSKNNGLKFVVPRNSLKSILVILECGIPSFFNEFANGFIVFLFNIQITKYCGDTALAVYSVISNCVILFNSLFTGVGQSIQPIVSTNFGAQMTDRVIKVKRLAFITCITMGLIFSLSGILFPGEICSIFMNTNASIENIADFALRSYFVAFLPLGINLISSYYLQSILEPKKSLCISVLRNIILSGAGILFLPIIFGGNSLWIVIPVTEVIVMIISLFTLKSSGKSLR